jgi:lysine-ketoglutarate reductase/saccharopine dehydrogenase-like protein (TIGR00300 family)
MPHETVSLDGHIVDSLTLSKVLDLVLLHGGTYEISKFHIGATRSDSSHAEITVTAESADQLESILHLIGQHGAARKSQPALFEPAPMNGVFPDGFYSTTNLESFVRLPDQWIPVQNTEMDCAIVRRVSGKDCSAHCIPLHRVRKGDMIVVGDQGVRVTPPARSDPSDLFSFMGSEVSSERPKELIVEAVVEAMKETHAQGKRILLVGGPAIIHTGAARHLEAIIEGGWIDVLFAGNALATHDIEQSLFGTSLGVDLKTGTPTAHGHEHHLRAINAIRKAGSIKTAVESGLLKSGIMHACVKKNVDFVLAGSIRDDGPLPDVITDSVRAQDAMREQVRNVGVAIMVATTLHSVATGNLLPATVKTICVDSDADTVIKLMDRGTHQAFGLVTDCEFFVKELARRLPGVSL